jgi:DDE superfamily endonuclease/Helix-turn-helix of DDE superfamily endonuclease
MILQYSNLALHPRVFRAVTGLTLAEFATLFRDVCPSYLAAELTRHTRPARQRAIGAGPPFELDPRDQLLLTIVWLRTYPTQVVLGFLFAVSPATVSRYTARWLPLLAQAGRDEMRRADPGRKHRRSLDQVLQQVPELTALVDSFEQRVQRPPDPHEQRRHYSGKKKQHTLKSQVVVQPGTGLFLDVAESVPGPTNDRTLLKQSGVRARLPRDAVLGGDLGYFGEAKEAEDVAIATPRRKPRGQERPPEDILYNQAFARARVEVERSIGRLRRYQALAQTDRHHRRQHTERVQSVAGLVNRQIRRHWAYLDH